MRLRKIWQTGYVLLMCTMNTSLPKTLKAYVDEQVAGRGYAWPAT